jgi:hypothetical protein
VRSESSGGMRAVKQPPGGEEERAPHGVERPLVPSRNPLGHQLKLAVYP